MTIQSEIQALKCADCARSDSAVSDLRPDSLLPIPADALSGWRDGKPGTAGVTRRKLLRNGVLGFAAVYGATQLSFEDVWESAVAQAAEPMGRSLVVIYLNGGNDGLNCFVPQAPTEYMTYQSLRPSIARVIGPGVGATRRHDADAGYRQLRWGSPTSSSRAPPPTRTATPRASTRSTATARAARDPISRSSRPPTTTRPTARTSRAATTGSPERSRSCRPAGSVAGWTPTARPPIRSRRSRSTRASPSRSAPRRRRCAALEGLQGVGFTVPGVTGDVNSEVGKLAAVPVGAGNDALGRSRGDVGPHGRRRQPAHGDPRRRARLPGYPPNSGLSQKLQLAATLLSAGLGTRIVTIDWGSFDTHGDQLAGQDPQLATLSRALAAFKADLAARGVEQNVVTMVFSEFGRRLEESDSKGTDHGSGGPIMLSGSAVRGGLAGEHPGVNVNQDGDLVVKTDFRTVYQALIAEWLGGDPTAILPGGPFPGVARSDGGTTLMKAA